MSTAYTITTKGEHKAYQKRIIFSFPQMDFVIVLQYIASRKTPATFEEICRGTQPQTRIGKIFNVFGGTGTTPYSVKQALSWLLERNLIKVHKI